MFTRSIKQRGLGTLPKVLIFLVIVVAVVYSAVEWVKPQLGYRALISVMEEQARFAQARSDAMIRVEIERVANKNNIPLPNGAKRDIIIQRDRPQPGQMTIKVRPYKKTVDLFVYKEVFKFKPEVNEKMGSGFN